MGPPLRILTDGADGRKHLIRHGLRPCHLPLKGKAEGRRGRRPLREMGGKLLPVGADLCVRPASLSKGAPGEAGWGIPLTGTVPQVAPSSGPAGHLPPRGKVRRVQEAAPFVVASSTSLASACGESSLIALLRLSPPNPRLPPLGFGGGPKNSYLLSHISTLTSCL